MGGQLATASPASAASPLWQTTRALEPSLHGRLILAAAPLRLELPRSSGGGFTARAAAGLSSLAPPPQGALFATASEDNTVRIFAWDALQSGGSGVASLPHGGVGGGGER